MDFLFLILLLALFLLPTILLGRKQRQHQAQIAQMQSQLAPGDQIVTGSGMHGQIVELHDQVLAVEIAPGVVVDMDRAAILRKVEVGPAPDPVLGEGVDAQSLDDDYSVGNDPQPEPRKDDDHPENFR